MSGSINLHQEAKVAGVWHHVAQVYPPVFSYEIFHLLGYPERRDSDSETALVPLKGLPEDMSVITRIGRSETDDGDITGESWANSEEVAAVCNRHEEIFSQVSLNYLALGYLYGNGWNEWHDFKDARESLQKLGIKDIRWVYWFTT